MLNFYHRFIPHCASVLQPLYACLRVKAQTSNLKWTPEMTSAFESAKSALSNATLLTHPQPYATLALSTDASDIGLGAVLEQLNGNAWQPLSFFSRQLTAAEKKYSAFDRELLALFAAVRHFRHILEGRSFQVFTDHKPLVDALHKRSDPWTGRQQRQLSFVSEFNLEIHHISGKINVTADCLSRASVGAVQSAHLGVDLAELSAAQRTSEDIKACRTAVTNLQLDDVDF